MTLPCLPPHAQFEPPSFTLPLGACDSHAHVFGPFAAHPLADDRSYTPDEFPADAFIQHLDRFGLSRGVLVTGSASGTDNGSVLSALRRYPQRLRGVAVAEGATSRSEMERMHQDGVRGLRGNLYRHEGRAVYRNGVGLEDLEALAPLMRELGWHAQVWIHAPDLVELEGRLRQLRVPLVIDHMGRMATGKGVDNEGFQTLCRLLAEGVGWAKISGADRNTATGNPYLDVDPYAKALLNANHERVVWGSDWPHINYFAEHQVPDDGVLLNLLARWIPEEAVRRKVLVENPARLYDFPAL